jgi:uncharacterized protein YecE (DUF72 family)
VEDAEVTTQPSSSSPSSAVPQANDTRAAVWLGCSGWAYPSWMPGFYPPKTPPKKMLGYYATQLNSVEVNYTFRHLPSATTIDGWLAQTGADFRFSFKAPQRITHIKRLKDASDALSAFYSALLPVIRAGRMGVILFQLPPNLKADRERLAGFLQEAALCVAESDELQTPDVTTAPFSCYRLRKSEYGAADLERVEKQLTEKSAQGDVFAYIKHEDSPQGALQAASLLARWKTQ